MGDSDRQRLEGPDARAWTRWGPKVPERAGGTVGEDGGEGGDTTGPHLPDDHARARACGRGEDGPGGAPDDHQALCPAVASRAGRDPIRTGASHHAGRTGLVAGPFIAGPGRGAGT